MRDLTEPAVDQHRRTDFELSIYGGNDNPAGEGVFLLHHRGRWFFCIVSTGDGWDHVSVSVRRNLGPGGLPGWYDLEYVRRVFFKDDETVMQLHVPSEEHISHGEVLHLWRPQLEQIPKPPAIMVGVRGLDLAKPGA